MTIGPVLLELLEQIKVDQCTPEIRVTLKEQIESAVDDLTSNPRDRTEGNLKLLNATIVVALGTAEDLYGAGDDTRLHQLPIFEFQPQSQIVPLLGDHGTVAVVLGEYVRTWEEVFYDICHESLHLLNPIINVKDDTVKVSALEEGCAVKFAEEMYEKHIKPYCDRIPLTSPILAPTSQYFLAYSATKKIPDNVLKEVRKVFGRFSNVNEVEKFKAMVGAYVNDEEIELLIKPFAYK
jgi:hypothetical protein